MFHSTRLSGSHPVPRDLSLLITARDSYFGSCTCLFFFRDTFRDLRIACNSRSTPFLNIHWYQNHSTPGRALRLTVTPFRMLDKTEQTGSPLQFVNGLILMSTFAGARLVYGSIIVRSLPRSIYTSIDHLTYGRSPVVAVLPNALRGTGRALDGYYRRIPLWKCRPERAKRFLVSSIRLGEIFFLLFLCLLGSVGAEDDNARK
jgi:hypothetical protein